MFKSGFGFLDENTSQTDRHITTNGNLFTKSEDNINPSVLYFFMAKFLHITLKISFPGLDVVERAIMSVKLVTIDQ